jgi:hypothetical protein
MGIRPSSYHFGHLQLTPKQPFRRASTDNYLIIKDYFARRNDETLSRSRFPKEDSIAICIAGKTKLSKN